MKSQSTALLFTGGDPVDPTIATRLPQDALVIAADSGVAQAAAVGRRVDIAVGDFDSVDPAVLAAVEAAGAVVERHPAAKDATDLELGLATALAHGVDRVVVVGGYGGRLDHFLANAMLLASPRFAAMRVEALMDAARVVVVRDNVDLLGAPGELVSLLAMGAGAEGVWTDGLLYPLRGERLEPGSTRGVSNEFCGHTAAVRVEQGALLAVQPGVIGTHVLRDLAGASARKGLQ